MISNDFISAVVNHLWQSTVVVAVAWALTPALKRNHARVRYWIWMAASVKFLLPFSLLIAAGGWLRSLLSASVVARPAVAIAMEQVAQPFAARQFFGVTPMPVVAHHANWLPLAFLMTWAIGALAVIGRLALGWWRVYSAKRAARSVELECDVPVLCSLALMEPGIFGIFRPVLLLPEGILSQLTAEQLGAIVAHEMCHVKRRDNLTFAMHMIVEALFWFHPAVWLIGERLIEERERACDEAVLRTGSGARNYAESILAVCKFHLKSSTACVAGVTGADLRRRVETILSNHIADRMDMGRKLLLFAMGALTLTLPLIAGIVSVPLFPAQEPANPLPQLITKSDLPEFEVASIKPSAPDSGLKVNFAPGGKLYITNATLRFLIKIAYDIGDDQLAGGPKWMESKRFDVAAIPDIPVGGDPKNMAPDQILVFHKPTRLRLQRLLADRFQLELRKESTPMPVFDLVVAKGGQRKLTVTRSIGGPQLNADPANGELNAVGVDMATLAKFLSEGQTGRPVVDMTGLKDKYDFRLNWSPDTGLNALPADSAAIQQPLDAGGISIFAALKQQLGLKLEARTNSADRLVVLHAELPSAN